MKRSTKIILLIVAAFAAVSMVLTGCGKDSESISDNSAATADSVMTEPQEEVYEIDTAIGKLYYPVKWKDKITFRQGGFLLQRRHRGVCAEARRQRGLFGRNI